MNIEVTQKADGWMLGTIEGGYEWQAIVRWRSGMPTPG